jgi:hypothetical protein
MEDFRCRCPDLEMAVEKNFPVTGIVLTTGQNKYWQGA